MSKNKSIRFYDKEYSSILKYPFKSKYKYLESNLQPFYESTIKTEPFIPDFKLKSCKLLSKPNFSNEPGCWESDLMFASYYSQNADQVKNEVLGNFVASKTSQIYLVMINVNTRYLIVEPMKDKSDVSNALKRIISNNPKFEFKTIKCDGESGFISLKDECIVIKCKAHTILQTNLSRLIMNVFHHNIERQNQTRNRILNRNISALQSLYNNSYKLFDKNIPHTNENMMLKIKDLIDYYPIKFVINSSPYTLAHKEVDAVIRTLRNAFGMNDRRIADYELMRQMVNFYNNTPHNSLRFRNFRYVDLDSYNKSGLIPPTKYVYYTPAQMQNDLDLEWRYIRMMKLKLRDINNKQQSKSLLSYKYGNIILVHLDRGKTQKKHEKRRRVFDEIAEFIRYQNGNVICKLLNPYHNYTNDNGKLVPFQPSEKGRIAQTDAEKAIIEVPIIYTKRVCNSIEELNDDYKRYFNLL